MSFVFDLFKKINVPENENIIISPNSIFQILSLFCNFAGNNIQKEILKSLNFNNITDLNNHNYNMIKILNDLKCYKSINSIFLNKELYNNYVNLANKFDIHCEEINSIEQINNWYSQKTNYKISNIINTINNTQLLALNGTYFIENWENKFNKEYIKNEIFDNKENIEMMKQNGFFNYFENGNLQIIEIPLANDYISALILLPAQNKDINQIINELNDNNLELIYSNLKNQEIELKLPKLSFNCNYSLNEPLKKLGFSNLFEEEIQKSFIINNNYININQFNQKIYLNIDEDKKIKTGIIYNSNSFINMKHMNVNRPFILIIKINNVKSPFNILFISKISRINENIINQNLNNPLIINPNNDNNNDSNSELKSKEINFLPVDQNNDVHLHIQCDKCQTKDIKGIRYKCLVCDNFDFCEKCERYNAQTQEHPHPFIKIYKNNQIPIKFGITIIRNGKILNNE